jgi:hypothetical protein
MSAYNEPTIASSKRLVADLRMMEHSVPEIWEQMYQYMFDPKYKKNTRNFSRTITGKRMSTTPPIYLIPRERGGPSYKETRLIGLESNDDVQFCPIS